MLIVVVFVVVVLTANPVMLVLIVCPDTVMLAPVHPRLHP